MDGVRGVLSFERHLFREVRRCDGAMPYLEEEEEPHLFCKAPRYRRLQVVCKCTQVVRTTMPYQSRLYPCTLPTAPVSRSFGLRSSYESVSLTPTKDPGEKEMRTQDSPLSVGIVSAL